MYVLHASTTSFLLRQRSVADVEHLCPLSQQRVCKLQFSLNAKHVSLRILRISAVIASFFIETNLCIGEESLPFTKKDAQSRVK